MSLFRDISYIKSISSSNNLKEVSDDACRLILWNMEIHLRTVIKEAIKYTQHFKRDNLTDEDVNCALLNVKQGDKMVGLRTPYENKYLLNEENRWSLENRVLVINERMKEVEFDHFENLAIVKFVPDIGQALRQEDLPGDAQELFGVNDGRSAHK